MNEENKIDNRFNIENTKKNNYIWCYSVIIGLLLLLSFEDMLASSSLYNAWFIDSYLSFFVLLFKYLTTFYKISIFTINFI